ncbi:hypothetical protein BY996DRAFT_6522809 [Phakopsora pachyrhizi]|nr:hypothetical protein BY996DRAFT_6522809 [Phakopsora pachyrhizi]
MKIFISIVRDMENYSNFSSVSQIQKLMECRWNYHPHFLQVKRKNLKGFLKDLDQIEKGDQSPGNLRIDGNERADRKTKRWLVKVEELMKQGGFYTVSM